MDQQTSFAQIGALASNAIAKAACDGITIYPVKLPSGKMTYGLHKVGPGASGQISRFRYEDSGRPWMVENEIARILSRVICNDYRLLEWRFFNAVAATQWMLPSKHIGADGDRYLIQSCRTIRNLIKKESEANNLLCERLELFEDEEPQAPMEPGRDRGRPVREKSAAEMKEHLRKAKSCNTKKVLVAYRKRIAAVVAYERQIAALNKKYGIPALDRCVRRYHEQIKYLALEIATLPAFTQVGMAWKASLIRPLFGISYGFQPYLEELTLSLADDARMLGTGSPERLEVLAMETRSASERNEPAEAYHAIAAE